MVVTAAIRLHVYRLRARHLSWGLGVLLLLRKAATDSHTSRALGYSLSVHANVEVLDVLKGGHSVVTRDTCCEFCGFTWSFEVSLGFHRSGWTR